MAQPHLFHRLLSHFLRIFFDLLYHQLSWAYDLVASIVSLGMWKEWVSGVLPDLDGPRVLEIGHGPGHLQVKLNQKKVQIIGIDQSFQMGRLAYRRLQKHQFVPSVVISEAQHLPFANHSFDQLVSTFPSEYIVDLLTLTEAHRVLVPGGRFVIMPVAWIRGRGWLERLASWLFQFTGQAPEWDDRFVEPFIRAGFTLQVEKRASKSVVLLVLLAQKLDALTDEFTNSPS